MIQMKEMTEEQKVIEQTETKETVDTPVEEHVEEHVDIENSVNFLGYRKDINKIMQVADVLYHQSFHEGLTMSIMEAMHYGLPIIASNVRGNKDLVDDKKGGIITKTKDMDEQVKALHTLLNNADLRKQYGEYNKVKVKEYYLEQVKQQLAKIYEEIE